MDLVRYDTNDVHGPYFKSKAVNGILDYCVTNEKEFS